MTPLELRAVPAPRSPVYRIGRAPNPFSLPDWSYAGPDGTFGNRFDDPRGRRGVPPAQRFRILYLASGPAGAYGETIAQFQPSLKTLSGAHNAHAPGGRRDRATVP